MVGVGEKAETRRVAVTQGRIVMQPETLAMIRDGAAKKGDVLGVARLAGIMAAKRTHELRHYTNLAACGPRWERLLRSRSWCTISDLLERGRRTS